MVKIVEFDTGNNVVKSQDYDPSVPQHSLLTYPQAIVNSLWNTAELLAVKPTVFVWDAAVLVTTTTDPASYLFAKGMQIRQSAANRMDMRWQGIRNFVENFGTVAFDHLLISSKNLMPLPLRQAMMNTQAYQNASLRKKEFDRTWDTILNTLSNTSGPEKTELVTTAALSFSGGFAIGKAIQMASNQYRYGTSKPPLFHLTEEFHSESSIPFHLMPRLTHDDIRSHRFGTKDVDMVITIPDSGLKL